MPESATKQLYEEILKGMKSGTFGLVFKRYPI
jgi:hypothetical protein